MDQKYDFQFVGKPKTQEICTNPLYYAYPQGEAIKLGALDDSIADKISFFKHTPKYILIKIGSKDICVLPEYPRVLERHVRIDRVFAKKGDHRIILSKLHFTWIFANANGEKIEFRGYYNDNSFHCMQTKGKGKTKIFITDERLLNILQEQSKIEYLLFLEINAKKESQYYIAQSRYEAQSEAMSATEYLATVTDEQLASDMAICATYFQMFKNLSNHNIDNVFETFRNNINSQLHALRNPSIKEEDSNVALQEPSLTLEEKAPISKAAKKKKKNKAKLTRDPNYIKNEISKLQNMTNEMMAKFNQSKKDTSRTPNHFLTYVIEANAQKRAWEKAATPIWCELDDKSTDLKKLEIMRDLLEKIPSKIQVASGSNKPDHPIGKQAIPVLFPDREDLFEIFFEELLLEYCFRPLKDEADFEKTFGVKIEEIIQPQKTKYLSREQAVLEYIFNIQQFHEEEFCELLLELATHYDKRYATFIANIKSAIMSHKNLDTPVKKNAYNTILALAHKGRHLILQDLISSCITLNYSDAFELLANIDEIRKKIKKDHISAWFCLGEAKGLCLNTICSQFSNSSSLQKTIFNTYYEMWRTIQEHFKDANLQEPYVCTALEFSLYKSMKNAKDKLQPKVKKSPPTQALVDKAEPVAAPPLTFAYQSHANKEENEVAESLLKLNISNENQNQYRPRKLDFN